MKRIALYGYGIYGKRAAESFRFYWGDEYRITAVFDRGLAGENVEYWKLTVLHPERIKEEYAAGVFESVMVCISDEETRSFVKEQIAAMDIPLFVPGSADDFAEPKDFVQDPDPGIAIDQEQYSLHAYKDMYGVAADHARWQILFLFNEEGRVNIDNYRMYRDAFGPLLLMYPFRLKNPVPEKVYMKGDWCIIAKAFSSNYWHFTYEAADCVYLMEKAGYRGKYIFNDLPFARELLEIMGISSDRLIGTKELEIHKVYVFERLFVINHAGMEKQETSPETIAAMADDFREKLNRDESSPRRIYIKRIGRRRLLNGEDTAVKNGFRIIVPEEYSVQEQMNLFYNADIVLCPHGANSANCLYMHKGAVFAEIFSDLWYVPINADICEANGVHYRQMIGDACSDKPEDVDADYQADEETLQDLIREAEKIIAGTASGADDRFRKSEKQ